MAEEQRCGEGHRLCANNCGFFGSPATLNLCSKCYRDCRLKEEHATSAKAAVEKSLHHISATAAAVAVSISPDVVTGESNDVKTTSPASDVSTSSAASASGPSRCMTCRKKVGLTGFKCRCGSSFCGAHRYPEQHACSFDFKSAGRDAIAKANPLVKADKLDNKI